MALIRWEPARELPSLQGEMNRLFNTFFDTPQNAGNGTSRWTPAMDLVEEGDHFMLCADLPGMTEDDVKIEVERDVLVLSGERRHEHKEEGEGFYRLERASGAFRRTLHLPEGVQADGIQASFDKGVLEVRIPKPEERKPRRIEIAVGERPAAIEGTEAEAA